MLRLGQSALRRLFRVRRPKDDLDKQRAPKPKAVALVFSFGYGGDSMPAEDDRFDALLNKLKEARFNVVHCTFTDKRLELCKKHGMQMMVDLLAPEHHVYKSPEKAEAVCKKLRGNPVVWGYNIWNDPIRSTTPGRKRDINNVRLWDPTHPAYCGTYRVDGMSGLTNADMLGYYDFHWKRAPHYHFPHLMAFKTWCNERDAWFATWLSATSGLAGKGNFNRSLYSANTGFAFGLKGILWFLGGDLMDAKTLEWTAAGEDIIKVHAEIAPLAEILVTLGQPSAIYSTPITRTMNNDALPDGKKEMMPPGLDKHGFPKDFWAQPEGGEFVLGVFEEKGRQLFLANHNAYAAQEVKLRLTRPGAMHRFDRKTTRWTPLKVEEGIVRVDLAAGGGELLRAE